MFRRFGKLYQGGTWTDQLVAGPTRKGLLLYKWRFVAQREHPRLKRSTGLLRIGLPEMNHGRRQTINDMKKQRPLSCFSCIFHASAIVLMARDLYTDQCKYGHIRIHQSPAPDGLRDSWTVWLSCRLDFSVQGSKQSPQFNFTPRFWNHVAKVVYELWITMGKWGKNES